jgi:hypothetical protein
VISYFAGGRAAVQFWDAIEKTYNHPQLGLLKFYQATFSPATDPTLKLVILQRCR